MKNRICKIVALLSLFVLLLSSPTLAMAATLSHQYDEVGYCTSDLPLIKVKKGEKFVNTIGEMAQRYLMNHIHALEDTRQLTVIDEKDVVHFLHNEDVVYVAAEGRNCRIYTVDGSEICGRLNMTEFQQICGKELVPVHRSYVINRNYISLIQRYEVVMLDGSKIPIPVKKYKEMKDCLTEMHGVNKEK